MTPSTSHPTGAAPDFAPTPLTQETFSQGMAILRSRWRNQAMDGELAAAFAAALSDLSREEFIVAIRRAIAELEFFPTAKQLRALARPEVEPESEAGVVLTQILSDADVGQYHPVMGRQYDLAAIAEKYGAPARLAILAMGGAHRLARITDDDLPFVLRDFRKHFADFTRELVSQGALERIGGGALPGLRAPSYRTFAKPEARRALKAGLEKAGDVVARLASEDDASSGEATP